MLALLGLSACRSAPPQSANTPPPAPPTAQTLLEARLLDLIADSDALAAMATDAAPSDFGVERRFRSIAARFNSVIADNPDSLEARLLYGKFLADYGDREGARDQFLHAAQIDPSIAVIHQQLGNFYAEERDPTRAMAFYLNAIGLDPDIPAYHFGLGELIAHFFAELTGDPAFDPTKLHAQMLNAFANAARLAPDNLIFQFRYGEAFYDVPNPDFDTAIAHWLSLLQHPQLSAIQRDAVRLHLARNLLDADRAPEALPFLDAVATPGLQHSRDELRNAIPAGR